MTKMQKRIVMYMAAILILLALVCTCLVGNTFARFTSSDTISGSANTAKWSISQDTSSVQTVNDAQLSPNMSKYGYNPAGESVTTSDDSTNYVEVSGSYYRYNTMSKVLVATLKNDSDVTAYVKFEQGDLTFYDQQTPAAAISNWDSTGYSYSSGLSGSAASKTQVEACFAYTITVTSDDAGSTTVDKSNATNYTDYYEVASGTTYYIWAALTWTSYDVNSETDGGVVADAIDTWIGLNISKVETTITYTAIQGSQIPVSA